MFCYMQVLINRNTIANVICQAGMKLTYLPYRHIFLTEKNLTRLKSDVEFIRHSVLVEMYEEFSFLQLRLQIYYVGIYFSHHIQTMQFSIKNFFSKYDQISSFLWIWPHLLNKSLMETFIFCAISLETLMMHMVCSMLKGSGNMILKTKCRQ